MRRVLLLVWSAGLACRSPPPPPAPDPPAAVADLHAVADAVECLARCRDDAIGRLRECHRVRIYCGGAEDTAAEEVCIAGCVASKPVLLRGAPASSVVAAHACVFANEESVRCRYATQGASFALPCCGEDRVVRSGAVCPAYGECR
ncbi:MAG: hypothetical protein IPJ34_26695 [Myxococcales bacterium]|nr:hypothetical protein [Myxococcales bacterium]